MNSMAPMTRRHGHGGGLTLRYYQSDAVDAAWDFLANDRGNGLIVLPTGCHAVGTLILMYDGSVKPVEDVRVGDQLMGPDSKPRNVLALARGREPMRRIVPVKGDPFVVNENHILSLARTNEGKGYPCNMNGEGTDEISIVEWENKSKYWRHLRKLRKVAVNFPEIEAPEIDPWVMGCLLADGGMSQELVGITKNDFEILDGVQAEMERFGLNTRKVQKPDKSCWMYFFTRKEGTEQENAVTKILRKLGLSGSTAATKFIPDIYKLGSREVRLGVLAGLLDGDGHHDVCGTFDYISKSKRLSDDLVFVARSLGFRAKCVPSEKYSQDGVGGTYWRVNVSGHLNLIPTRVERKKAAPRKQKKNPLVTGFSVKKLPEDDFYGFSLDGDHLYLTADFFVHHNTGKALALCELCKRAMEDSDGEARIFILTFAKELVAQNYQEMLNLWPDAPAGIYSAGLNKRETDKNLIFGSIQSVHRRAYQLQRCHLIIVDEAQAIPRDSDTTWNRFFKDVRDINGDVRVIGLTATDFRLDSGRLTEGKNKPFDKIIYEYSIIEAIEEGFLTAPISRAGGVEIETAGLHTRGGDFAANELEAVAIEPETVEAIANEMAAAGQDREGWILFGAGVRHCMMLRAALRRRGVDCEGVFATEPEDYTADGGRPYNRDQFVEEFKQKKIKCLVSVKALAVGFNAKHVDLIGIARPTQSVGLYIQIVGRGTRPLYAPGFDLETKQGRLDAIRYGSKPNCLVLDWGGNIARHGLIDQPNVKRPAPATGTGEIPLKSCPMCQYMNFVAARECLQCGFVFDIKGAKLSTYASGGAMLSTQLPPPKWIPVDAVSYFRNAGKNGKVDTLKVSYKVGINFYNEWICFDHPKGSYPRNKAEGWWRARVAAEYIDIPPPESVAEALTRGKELREPTNIQVRPSGKEAKFFEVIKVNFEEVQGV